MNALLIVILMLYLTSLWVFCLKRKHLSIVLLSLEYMVLMKYLMVMLMLMSYDYNMHMLMVFLVFAVCEGALGLGILVSVIRLMGTIVFFLGILYCDVKVNFLLSFYDPTFGFNNMWLVYGSIYNKSYNFLMMLFLVSSGFWNISMGLGMDLMSYGLMLLSVWICMLMIMASGD